MKPLYIWVSVSCSHRAFDVELLYIAQCFKIPIAEVAVNWTEIEGRLIEYMDMHFLLVLFFNICLLNVWRV